MCKTARSLQEEGRGKQAGWSKGVQNRKITPSGRKRKARGGGAEAGKTGRLLQVEGKGKQAGWSRCVQNSKIAPNIKKRKEKHG